MKNKIWKFSLLFACLVNYSTFFPSANAQPGRPIPLDNFTYIEVDNSRAKWGDWDPPRFLRYFGLDMHDVTGNGYKDIVSGRYFYRNPGGDMTAPWERVDLRRNVDGLMFLNIKGEKYGQIIAAAFPDVFWLSAKDQQGSIWEAIRVTQVPPTTHNNGQGYRKAQIIPGAHEEILLATGGGIYYIEIPTSKSRRLAGNWPTTLAAAEASDEGFATADIDGDGLVDIIAAVRKGDQEGESMEIRWWKNPGNGQSNWLSYPLGFTEYDADRIEVADLNGNGKYDIIVSEERWPGKEPDASLFWYEQPADPTSNNWKRHLIVKTYSLNNLDVADINKNGYPDIVTAEHKGEALRTLIYSNDGKGNFTEHVVDRRKEAHLGTRLADLNGNGFLDIVSIGWDHYTFLHIWRNNGDRWRHRRPFVPWNP
jgi:hypothetical protein